MKIPIDELALSTFVQVGWIGVIGRHYSVGFITGTLLVIVALSFYLLDRAIRAYPWYGRALVGAMIGFFAGIAATFVAELALRGTAILLRQYPLENFYFFPTLLFGWVYGAIFFVAGTVISGRRRV